MSLSKLKQRSKSSTARKRIVSKNITEPVPVRPALETGPLQEMFPCSTSKILDFICVFDKWDYSISDIAKNSGVTFKTALNEVRKLKEKGIINRTRTVGKAIMFQWNPASAQAKSIGKLAFEIAKKRIHKSIES